MRDVKQGELTMGIIGYAKAGGKIARIFQVAERNSRNARHFYRYPLNPTTSSSRPSVTANGFTSIP